VRNSAIVFFGPWLAVALCVGGCATKPTIYQAPDNSKVTATTKRLSAAIDRENETWKSAEAKVQAAQQSYDRVAGHSASVLQLIKELEPFIPAEQKPKFDELKASAGAQIDEEGTLSFSIAGAQGAIEQGKKDHAVVVTERDKLKLDQANYQTDAKKIADAATEESRQKAEYKNQLTSQKILRWAFRLGGGAIIIAIVVLFVTGKISIAAIRVYLKSFGV
jgi:hypothetical protein